MKKMFISVGTTGADVSKHGIIQISGIIDIDSTIMDVFDFKCKPYINDEFNDEILDNYGVDRMELITDPERLDPKTVFDKIMKLIYKYVGGGKDTVDKFQIIGYNSYGYEVPFLRHFFERNGNYNFYDYFWYPPIDIMLVSAFILEGYRTRFLHMSSYMVAEFFGYDVEFDKLSDSQYKVNLVRNLYYILEKFKAKTVLFHKPKIN